MAFGNIYGRVVALGLAVLAITLVMACNKADTADTTDEAAQTDPNLPPAQVDLPSPPPASAFKISEKNDDGTLRVQGLIHYADKHWDKKVRVKGIVVQINGDCDPAKAKQKGEPCLEPHFVIKDDQEAEKQLAVVGFERDFFKRAKANIGEIHVFEGTYKKMAQQFVNSGDGLILLDKVDDISVSDVK